MPNYRYEIEILTPLHIGSGEKIYPLEYVIDKEFIRVNMDKLFAESSFSREKFINESKKKDFFLGTFDKNNALKYPLYKTTIASDTRIELVKNIGTPNALVLDFIKEGKNFYIPGSSLKGAIRTTILWKFLQKSDVKNEFETILAKKLNKIKTLEEEINKTEDDQKVKKIKREIASLFKKEQVALSSEEYILGIPNYSILKALHIGDSNFLSPSSISVEVSKVLSKTGNGFKWKQLGRDRGNTDNPRDATPIFFEAIKSGTKIKGSIKIDEFLLSEDVAEALKFRDTTLLKELAKTCNAFAHQHLEEELIFFQSVGLKQIQDKLERIKNISLTDNEFILHLAWGSGYEAKALGNSIDKSLFNEIRNVWNLGKRDIEFPKTRKIVFKNEEPNTVIGWVKLKLET